MKFIVEKDKIIKPLSKLSSYLSYSVKNPILSNILLFIELDVLFFVVTDLDIEIKFSIKLKKKYIFEKGAVTVNANKLYEICNSFPKNSELIMNFVKKRFIVSCFKSVVFFSTMPSKNFPFITKKFKYKYKFFLSSILLKEIISSIYFAIGNQDIYYYLNGVFIEYKDNNFFFVATDGHRMSMYKLINNYVFLLKNKNKEDFSIIISRKFIIELFKILNIVSSENKILFKVSNYSIKLYFDNFVMYSRLINGSFPDYKNMFCFEDYKYIILDILNFKDSLLRSSIINDFSFNYVTLCIKKNILCIFSTNNNNDEIQEKLIIDYNDFELKISFNVKYLLDVLNSIKDSSKIYFYFKNSFSIVKINSINNIYISHMIMPIRV